MSNEFQEFFWAVRLFNGCLKGPYTQSGNQMVSLYSSEGVAKRASSRRNGANVIKVKLVEVTDGQV